MDYNNKTEEYYMDRGICPYCKHELSKWIDKVPYGDTTADLVSYYCSNCGEV